MIKMLISVHMTMVINLVFDLTIVVDFATVVHGMAVDGLMVGIQVHGLLNNEVQLRKMLFNVCQLGVLDFIDALVMIWVFHNIDRAMVEMVIIVVVVVVIVLITIVVVVIVVPDLSVLLWVIKSIFDGLCKTVPTIRVVERFSRLLMEFISCLVLLFLELL